MSMNAAVNRYPVQMVSKWSGVMLPRGQELYYIGGADVLPAPLESEEEEKMLSQLGTEKEESAKSTLIEHNLRLVVYIAKKFDNTGVGV